MTTHLRVPGLLDIGIVDRAAQVFEIDDKAQVGREPHGADSLIGRLITGRLYKRLRVGNSPLPSFADRDAPGRKESLQELEQRLSETDLDTLPFRADVAQLAVYVGGREEFEAGVVAQQIIGRCFDPGFRATTETYEDARSIAGWATRPTPVAALAQLTGALDRARDRMWKICRYDRGMLHGTILALSNVVDALGRMRDLFKTKRDADAGTMLKACLRGPERLLRVTRGPLETKEGLSLDRGALVLYDLKSVHRWQPDYDLFMSGRWNQCPAHAFVPRLLMTVWKRAQRDARRPGRAIEECKKTTPSTLLGESVRSELTAGNLETLTQSELDEVYSRLDAGPMPSGPHVGRFFFPEGIGLRSFAEAAPELRGRIAGLSFDSIARIGMMLWKGKCFFPNGPNGDGEGLVRNIFEHGDEVAPLFGVHPSALHHAEIEGRRVPLLFPARLYRGASLADPRRQSIIIDYDEGPRIDGYVPHIDFLAGRDGLRIRDEIRCVRPGLYLGRAYTDQRLLLVFTLQSAAAELEAERSQPVVAKVTNGGGRHHSRAIGQG